MVENVLFFTYHFSIATCTKNIRQAKNISKRTWSGRAQWCQEDNRTSLFRIASDNIGSPYLFPSKKGNMSPIDGSLETVSKQSKRKEYGEYFKSLGRILKDDKIAASHNQGQI